MNYSMFNHTINCWEIVNGKLIQQAYIGYSLEQATSDFAEIIAKQCGEQRTGSQ